MNLYTADEVAKMTDKTRQAVTRWAQRNPGVGQKKGGVWLFTDADVKKIGALRRGPKRKPRKSRTTQPAQPEGGKHAAE